MEMLKMIMITIIFLQSNEIDVSIHMEIKGLKRGPKATKFVVYPLYNAIFFGARTKKKKQIMFLFQTFLFKDNKKLVIYSRHGILNFLRSLFNKSNTFFLLYEHFLTESCTEANPDNLMSSRYTRRKSLS